jgi:hypothetical protein
MHVISCADVKDFGKDTGGEVIDKSDRNSIAYQFIQFFSYKLPGLLQLGLLWPERIVYLQWDRILCSKQSLKVCRCHSRGQKHCIPLCPLLPSSLQACSMPKVAAV